MHASLTNQHRTPHLSNLLEALIVVEEEGEVLVGDVHFAVAALFPVLLNCLLATAERVLVNLQCVCV